MASPVIERDMDAELLLYDPTLDKVCILNATARVIYKLYQQGKSIEEIEKQLKDRFHTGKAANVAHDVKQFLANLKTTGLVD